MDTRECRICYNPNTPLAPLLSPCACRGTCEWICKVCLERIDYQIHCRTCQERYQHLSRFKLLIRYFRGNPYITSWTLYLIFSLLFTLKFFFDVYQLQVLYHQEKNMRLGPDCLISDLREELPYLTFGEYLEIDANLTCKEIKRRISLFQYVSVLNLEDDYVYNGAFSRHESECKPMFNWFTGLVKHRPDARNCFWTRLSFEKQSHHMKLQRIVYGWERYYKISKL
jgi:hypothetical protein